MSNFDPTEPNLPVQDVYTPSTRGITTGRTRASGSVTYVEIELGINVKKYVPLHQLELTSSESEGIEELLAKLKFGKIGDLARILTFHKIASKLSNVFYAMQASRTDFYAYQFKPVYKFIESTNQRLLIADEVGLGKTIEAGLIWVETRARNPEARRLLVVCPSMLTEKWKTELHIRFDLKARVYKSKQLLSLIEEFKIERDLFECVAICSLHTIRRDEVRDALKSLEDSNNRFDLVIIDEAHHMRNVETDSHKAGKTLSDQTNAMVLLTATPIQLKSEDLYRLLNILDQDEFAQQDVFEQRRVANLPIISAQNALRKHPPDLNAALQELKPLQSSTWFSDSTMLKLVMEQLAQASSQNHSELVEIQRRLENLNLLSSTISRTRKREVQENRVVRESGVLTIHFSLEEMTFYNQITEAVQRRVDAESNKGAAGFALMMPQRMMASSIPAMVEFYKSKVKTIDLELAEEVGILADDIEEFETVRFDEIDEIVEAWDSSTTDHKFEVFRAAILERLEREPDSKIIVFSYFKPTLRYLKRRLEELGLEPISIDGDVHMKEREELIKVFRTEERRRILLSSEVGSEGIDLQFCRIIFNYDLPWNPMKIEQRIGRIDRIGQKSEKISILNLSVTNTIEERILNRLLNRIGIFEESLGELEPILGKLTNELFTGLLSRRLSPEQEKEKITQTALAFEERIQQEKELSEQASVFMGSSDYILEQINESRNLGRWITPKDLKSYINDFFSEAYSGSTISWNEPTDGIVSLSLSNKAVNELRNYCQNQNPPIVTGLTNQTSELKQLIFDSEVAQLHRDCEMLTHFHPLVKWISEAYRESKDAFISTSAVTVKSKRVPAGDYLIGIQFWEFFGLRRDYEIAYAVTSLSDNTKFESADAEQLVQEILANGTSWEFSGYQLDKDLVSKEWEELVAEFSERHEVAYGHFSQENEEIISRRKSHERASFERKKQSVLQSIQTNSEKLRTATSEREIQKIESDIKGNYTKIENIKAASEQVLLEIETKSNTRNEFLDVAAVVCRVQKGID